MEISINDLFFSSWQDLHPHKAYRVVSSMHQYKGIHGTEKVRNESTLAVGGYHLKNVLKAVARPKKWKLIKTLRPEQMVDVYHDLFVHNPFRQFFVKRLSSSLSRIDLRAPDEALANLTFEQFKYADHEFSKLVVARQADDQEAFKTQVNRLVATLYVPKGQAFDRSAVDKICSQVERVALFWQKELIVEAYANTREALIRRCPYLWPGSEDAKSQDPQAAAELTGPIWHELHFEVAEQTEAFKGFKTVSQANLYDLVDFLEKLAKDKASVND